MEDSGIESDVKNLHTTDDILFKDTDSDSSTTGVIGQDYPSMKVPPLSRKLVQSVNQVKKYHIYQPQDLKKQICGPSLIPLQRLSIPSKPVTAINKENVPLVDWDTDESEEDVHFFPISKSKESSKQNLKDTFSVEEFEISPDEDDLNLLPPNPVEHRYLCCYYPENRCTIV